MKKSNSTGFFFYMKLQRFTLDVVINSFETKYFYPYLQLLSPFINVLHYLWTYFDEFKKYFPSSGAKLNERSSDRKKLILFCKNYHKSRLMGIIVPQGNEKIPTM